MVSRHEEKRETWAEWLTVLGTTDVTYRRYSGLLGGMLQHAQPLHKMAFVLL